MHYLDKVRLVSDKRSGEASVPGPYFYDTSVLYIVGTCHLHPQRVRLPSALNDLDVGGEHSLKSSV
jgi:hypothetical protein